MAVADAFDAGGNKADFAGVKRVNVLHFGGKDTNLVNQIGVVVAHHADLGFALEYAIMDANQNDNSEIRVIPAVNQQGFQRCGGISLRCRQAPYNRLQKRRDAEPGFAGGFNGFGSVQADNVFNLLFYSFRFGRRQVDFVQYRNNLMIVVNSQIDVGQGLRFYALGGVNDQDRTFAGGQRARNFIGKIHVSRRINQVELVGFAVFGSIVEPHGLGFDGDSPLAFNIHGIENLLLHFAALQSAAVFNHAVSQGRFSVVNMGNDGKVADQI